MLSLPAFVVQLGFSQIVTFTLVFRCLNYSSHEMFYSSTVPIQVPSGMEDGWTTEIFERLKYFEIVGQYSKYEICMCMYE